MNKLFFLFISSVVLRNTVTEFSVDVELLNPISEREVSLRVKVTNLSNNACKVIKNRRQDFKREKIRALGNYIIQIEKWEVDNYILFVPSADIDLVNRKEEYVTLQKGDHFIDTIHVPGYIFSEIAGKRRGFPTGTYRLKIFFNLNEWSDEQINTSNWISFQIE